MATDSDGHRRFDEFTDDDPEATKAALLGDAERIAGDWQRVGADFYRAMEQALGRAKTSPPRVRVLGVRRFSRLWWRLLWARANIYNRLFCWWYDLRYPPRRNR